MKKRVLTGLFMVIMTATATKAQVSSTLSPYSQFGLGVLADQSLGFNRGMGGLAIGLRNGKIVNMQNPASYSAIDSLTMIIDAGVTGQITNFKESGKKTNKKTGTFDYAAVSFRLFKKVGFSAGVVPYSNIGYNYYNKEKLTNNLTSTLTSKGDGGFSQAYAGVGVEVLKGLSIGANVSYFWGKYEKSIVPQSSESSSDTQTRTYSASISSYKIDLGAQWIGTIDKRNQITTGLVVGLGHKLNGEANMTTTMVRSASSNSSTDTLSIDNALSIPFTFGAGVTWVHNNRLTVGLDYILQTWGSLDYPRYNRSTNKYELNSNILRNRHKFVVGADWIPDPMSRKFLKRVHYRMGVSYATPYYNIEGRDQNGQSVMNNGPKEFAVSAGFSIPIVNTWNNRSMLNISAQWVNTSAGGLLTENSFRINLGLTFNERWFAKWKVD